MDRLSQDIIDDGDKDAISYSRIYTAQNEQNQTDFACIQDVKKVIGAFSSRKLARRTLCEKLCSKIKFRIKIQNHRVSKK